MELTNLVVPVGWRLSTVGDSCEIDNHLRAPISSDVRKDMRGEYPYYGPTGILDHIEEYRVEGEYALIAEDGDHFLKYENVDMTLFVSGKFNVNNHAHLVKGKGDCSTEWVYDFFRRANLYPFITRQGAGRYKLNKAALQELPILIPPLPEQQKIAQILRTWDEAIATVEQLIAALQRRKKGLMQRLLTGQVRFPEFEFEGTPWQNVEIGDYLTPVTRTEPVEVGKDYRLIGVRWYLAGAHIHDVVPGDKIITQSLSRVEENDILYNKMWVSKAAFAVAKKEHHGAYGSGEYPQFVADDGLDVHFMEYAFHVPRFLHDAKALCRGTTGRIRLHSDDFLRLRMRLPSRSEQGKIAEVLQIADREINAMKQYLDGLRSQKKGLMQRLLTGQVRVQV